MSKNCVQNGTSKSISTLLLAAGPRENLRRRSSGSGAVFTNCSCSSPQHGMFLQFGCRSRQGIVEIANSRLCTGKTGEPTTVEKRDRCSCVGWEKVQSRIHFNEMNIFDTQEKTDPRNTNRFLLNHGKLRGFRASGKEWTFSCTVRVDLPWEDSEDVVEMLRVKFMQAEGA